MYVFVRNDLSPAQKAVQASHAAIEAARQLDENCDHPHLVVVVIRNKNKLAKVMEEIGTFHQVFPFYEEDGLTAFATEYVWGEARNKFQKYQLLK